jgi:hypothetical protein
MKSVVLRSAWSCLLAGSLLGQPSPSPAPPAFAPPSPNAPAEPLDVTPVPGAPDALAPEAPPAPSLPRGAAGPFRVTVQDDLGQMVHEAHRVARAAATEARAFVANFSSTSDRRTLVVPTGTLGGDGLRQAHEDLSVMARLFGRAASKSGRNQREFAFRFGEERDLDALYLEGYGALFFVSVDHAVIEATRIAEKKPEPKTDKDEVWERERRKLAGGDDEEDFGTDGDGEWLGPEPPEPFDAARVAKLKERLTAAFKHAANIRVIKPGEDVVLVVLGRGQAARNKVTQTKPRRGTTAGGAGGGMDFDVLKVTTGDLNGRQALTLRARKSEVDVLAAGKISVEDFAKQLRITTDAGLLSGSGDVQRQKF